MVTLHKHIQYILCGVFGILLIPLIAMQFTPQVNWSPFDFLVAAILLSVTGITANVIYRTTKSKQRKILLIAATLVVFVLIWLELAVGVFGTPLAGS